MTAALEEGEWSAARPGRTLPLGKTRYPFHRRLGRSQGRSGRAKNLSPTGIQSRTVQPVVSHYTDWATGPTFMKGTSGKYFTYISKYHNDTLKGLSCEYTWASSFLVRHISEHKISHQSHVMYAENYSIHLNAKPTHRIYRAAHTAAFMRINIWSRPLCSTHCNEYTACRRADDINCRRATGDGHGPTLRSSAFKRKSP